ncbi:hypothetical protein [Novosphingobium sp. FKTRR1]|uniref:DUF7146 domain-containing protein n=1 Tax=Novosphingobium sp. FKTRR1 TaxID=2879118 RepID=UPI001CEFD419|nr:hypothetical protein [Novosphingobium sp. FKTRR1]
MAYEPTPEQKAARAAELAELRRRLNERVDSLVPALLPGARRAGRFWEVGSLNGESGQSMKINRDGPMRGFWTAFKLQEGEPGRSGQMLDLVIAKKHAGNFGEAIKALRASEGLVGVTPEEAARFAREAEARAARAQAETTAAEAKKRSRAQALWHGAVSVHGTPAEAYLQYRVPGWRALGAWPGALRYRPDVGCPIRSHYPDWKGYPAMLAAVFGPDGAIVACHRTYLDISRWDHASKSGRVVQAKVLRPEVEDVDEDGEIHVTHGAPEICGASNLGLRGKIKSHKATLGKYHDVGGYIPLRKGASGARLKDVPAGTVPHFAEGIEDALNYAVRHPDAWIGAAVSLANLANVWLPPQAGGICFLADRDDSANEAAIASFEAAVAAHQMRRDDPDFVRAVWPSPGFKDFSDEAMARAREA